jgi:hypothetical protein
MPNNPAAIRPQNKNVKIKIKQQKSYDAAEMTRKRTSILILTLISIVVFLFILG